MRNKDYKDDQKVFRFINSDQCQSLGCLYDFLKDNNLPVRERWIFYLLGKFNYLDESNISSMEDKDSFGGYYSGEVYFWSLYIKNDEEKWAEIRDEISKKYKDYRIRIKELEKEIKELEHNIKVLDNCAKEDQAHSFTGEGLLINNILKLKDLKSGYEELQNIKLDNESLRLDVQKKFIEEGYNFVRFALESHFSMLERKAFLDYRDSENDYMDSNSSYCEACQESPCRCSDPDPN